MMDKEGKKEVRVKFSLKKHKELVNEAKKIDVPLTDYIKFKLHDEK